MSLLVPDPDEDGDLVAGLLETLRAAGLPVPPSTAPVLSVPDPAGASELSRVLNEVVGFLRGFVVLTDEQAWTCALWVVHTHAIEAAEATPYLWIHSAEKESGKTRTLEVLGLLVFEPMLTSNISDAALFRVIDAERPTVLFDEIDAIFGPRARDREDLRSLLNAGYQRGAFVWRMGGAQYTQLERFSVFSAKALAGLGRLPDTLASRSIPIQLKRRTAAERVRRFRRRDARGEAEPVREAIVEAVGPLLERLQAACPSLLTELSDRSQDVWEPLLALADEAGGIWPQRARQAALALSAPAGQEETSTGVQLLTDLESVFSEERIASADLCAALNGIEQSGWGGWNHGAGINPRELARLLKPFEIQPDAHRLDGRVLRGYQRADFADAFERYLPAGRNDRNSDRNSASHTGSAVAEDVADVAPATDESGPDREWF